MLIRSQDKKKLVNLDNVDSIHAKEGGRICAYNGDGRSEVVIGEYSTEEKASMVLNAMQDAYNSSIKLSISSKGEVQWQRVPVIFQMPEDDEV